MASFQQVRCQKCEMINPCSSLLRNPAASTAAPREQFAFDSVDFLGFMITLQEYFGLKIPETDYPLLSTLDDRPDCIRSGLVRQAD
jgi:acyl carrier protein